MHVDAPVCLGRKKHAKTVLMRSFESLFINAYLWHSDVFDLFLFQASRLLKFRLGIRLLWKPHTRPQKHAPAPTS